MYDATQYPDDFNSTLMACQKEGPAPCSRNKPQMFQVLPESDTGMMHKIDPKTLTLSVVTARDRSLGTCASLVRRINSFLAHSYGQISHASRPKLLFSSVLNFMSITRHVYVGPRVRDILLSSIGLGGNSPRLPFAFNKCLVVVALHVMSRRQGTTMSHTDALDH